MGVLGSFLVLFEDPFWVGLYERTDEDGYRVCKVTFGALPKDYEVYEFLLRHWCRLQFSPAVKAESGLERRKSPKRVQREISAGLQVHGASTKAQQALALQREQTKLERAVKSRVNRETEKERQFAFRLEKKKAKHKGH